MQVTLLPNISEELYAQAKKLSGYSIYHSAPWHNFISAFYGTPVHAIVGMDIYTGIRFFLPVVFRKNHFISLPLSHYLTSLHVEESPPQIAVEQALEGLPLEVHGEVSFAEKENEASYWRTVLALSNFSSVENWKETLPQKSILYMLKRAEREGLVLTRGQEEDDWNDFYSLMVETRHRQGSPVYPANFFSLLQENLGTECCSLYLVRKDGRAISGAVILHYNGQSFYAYSASTSLKSDRSLGGGELALFTAISDAFVRGDREFDFGSTPKSLPELKEYKEKWGGKSVDLFYTRLGGGKNIDRNSLKVKLATSIFRAMPQWLFKLVTPSIFMRL